MGSDGPVPGDEEEIAFWPPGAPSAEPDLVETRCRDCGLRWKIHRDLGGFRLRCRCQSWLQVPSRRAEAVPSPGAEGEGWEPRILPPPPRNGDGAEAPLAEAPLGPRRFLSGPDQVLLELTLLMLAFLAPPLLLQLAVKGDEATLLLPIASLASSLLVLTIDAFAGAESFLALRRGRLRHYVEGVLVAGLAFVLARGWVEVVEQLTEHRFEALSPLREVLGTGGALLVIAVCPAIFEEIAFRGLVQGRLIALLGPLQGVLVTAAAFGLAHGFTLGFPLQASLGVYLGSLRLRSRSLIPGMLVHFLYNGALLFV